MGVPSNIVDTKAVNASLDQELVRRFRGDADRLAEVLGVFGVEAVPAGTALKMLKATGELSNSKTEATTTLPGSGAFSLGSSSGSAYVEGDEVALSKIGAALESVGEVKAVPYRKMTSAAAIQRSGYANAVLATDRKMLSLVRAEVVKEFFSFLEKGASTASGKGLQAAAAAAAATLGDKMEANGDASDRVVHFVNRQDAAKYLGAAPVTTQTAFGLTYLEGFLGMDRVFLTSQVPVGKMYTTAAENVHVYGIDFSALAHAGLAYEQDPSGLIGVSHTPAYDHVSVETHVLRGMLLFPENADYVVKTTVS